MIGVGISPFFKKGGSLFNWDTYWSTRYPSDLTLTVLSDTSIKLDWTNNGVQDYGLISIRRSLDGDDFTEITTKTAGTATFTDTGLTEDTEYYYVLKYEKGDQNGVYSNVADATTNEDD